jgi:hypothetical protein
MLYCRQFLRYISELGLVYGHYETKLITDYSQQGETFLEFIYFYRPSTCFGRFLRPSSGAHYRTYSFRYCQPILLLATTVEEMELSSISSTVVASSNIVLTIPELEFIYFYRWFTCFRRFLRPSSGAHYCTYSFRYCQPILLLTTTAEEMELSSISSMVVASSSIGLTLPEAVCTVMCSWW